MSAESIIAIDGPSAAGKTSVAKLLAARLGYRYLDTGAVYRAAAVKLYTQKIPLEPESIHKALENAISIREENGVSRIFLDGADVTEEIRQHHVSRWASDASAIPAVREVLVRIQREIASPGRFVVEGRDIGTVVFPDARFKFFIDATIEERARRRQKELAERGITMDLKQVQRDILARDEQDSTRLAAPLRQAPDAIRIDTTKLNLEQVVEKILGILKADPGS
jgi:cytidylate kinase